MKTINGYRIVIGDLSNFVSRYAPADGYHWSSLYLQMAEHLMVLEAISRYSDDLFQAPYIYVTTTCVVSRSQVLFINYC